MYYKCTFFCGLFIFIVQLFKNGASPSGKAADFDSAIRRFKSSRPSIKIKLGEVAEWSKAQHWKCCIDYFYRGFESLSLLVFSFKHIIYYLSWYNTFRSVLSSVGRTLVSKTKCRGFKSFRACKCY